LLLRSFAFFVVNFNGKAAWIPKSLGGVLPMYNRRKTHKNRSLLPFFLKNLCPCIFGNRLVTCRPVRFEIAMCTGATGMNSAFRYFLAVKVTDFFNEIIIFQCGRTTVADRTDILVVCVRMPCLFVSVSSFSLFV